jgi:hypothetical protein
MESLLFLTSVSKVSNDVVPKEKYIKKKPSNKKQEIIAPKMKYFKPLSVENSELRLKVAKTYKHRLWSSIAR